MPFSSFSLSLISSLPSLFLFPQLSSFHSFDGISFHFLFTPPQSSYSLLSILPFPSFLPPFFTSLLDPVTFLLLYIPLSLFLLSSESSPSFPFFSSLFHPIVSFSFIPSLSLCIFFTHAPYYPPPSTILPLPPPPWSILFPPSYLLSFPFLFPLYLVSPSLNSHFPPLSLFIFHSSISFSLIFSL